MGFFRLFENEEDRFFRSLRDVSPKHEILGALAIGAHGFLGKSADDELVRPLVDSLVTAQAAARGWMSQRPSEAVQRAMRCESVLSIIACSFEIDASLATTLPHELLWQLARLVGRIALVERRFAWAQIPNAQVPAVSYSEDLEVCFTQLAVHLATLLHISDPGFRRLLLELGLQEKWSKLLIALRGLAIGVQRNPGETVIQKARQLLRQMPSSYKDEVMRVTSDGIRNPVALPRSQNQPMPVGKVPVRTGLSVLIFNSKGEIAGAVQFGSDGKANITTTPRADFIAAIMTPAVIFAQDLAPGERAVFSQWARLPTSSWTAEHIQLFATVFLYMVRDGVLRNEAFQATAPSLRRAKLPTLPFPINTELEALYRRMFSG